jgi:SagB-type dehydrogenase family enzyme
VPRRRTGRRTSTRFSRSPHLVAYWQSGTLHIVNYAVRTTSPANALVCAILDYCDEWRTAVDIARAVPAAASSLLPELLERLVDRSILIRSDRPVDPRVKAMHSLDAWNPHAGFFHATTKDLRFLSPAQGRAYARKHPQDSPRPPLIKKHKAASQVVLPAPADGESFTDVLLARRTSRRFSTLPVTIAELSSVLGLAAGVQQWASTPEGDVALKTSPSGGARHSIECYVVARNIERLRAGVYHYRPDRHLLERIGPAVPIERMRAYVPGSEYFASAAAMVFLTSVFEREIWRYRYARAYRATIAEAGHVCQTLLLVATSLGLASYCVMGIADSLIEADLRIDGITESVLYCAGVARMPKGKGPATLPRGSVKVRPNKYLRVRGS